MESWDFFKARKGLFYLDHQSHPLILWRRKLRPRKDNSLVILLTFRTAVYPIRGPLEEERRHFYSELHFTEGDIPIKPGKKGEYLSGTGSLGTFIPKF